MPGLRSYGRLLNDLVTFLKVRATLYLLVVLDRREAKTTFRMILCSVSAVRPSAQAKAAYPEYSATTGVAGLKALLDTLPDEAAEAALSFCTVNQVTDVKQLVQISGPDDEFLAALYAAGVKEGGIPDRIVHSRLQALREA